MDKNKEKEQIRRFLHLFQLESLKKLYPLQLSGGQQQRAALARMLISRPEILLFDEPFAALDSYLKEGLRMELLKILKDFNGVSILVTHDRDEAFQLCDQILVLDRGKVIDYGDTKEVFCHPKTEMSARVTGCKNISRIKRINSHTFCALDWDEIILHTDELIEDNITFAGVRAHSFRQCSAQDARRLQKRGEANLIAVSDAAVSEMPFEWYVTLKNHLWWKIEKKVSGSMEKKEMPPPLALSSAAGDTAVKR